MTDATRSPPRKPGRPRRADGRDALLDAATTLFASKGVAGTTLAHIAVHAGVTPAMVHYYFKNRDQLLDVVVAERLGPLIAYVWAPAAAAQSAAPDLRAMATQIVTRIVQCASERPWLPPLWMREVVNEGGMLRERVFSRLPVDRLHGFAHAIRAGQAAGIVNPGIEPRLVFLSILGITMLPMATAALSQRLWKDADNAAPDAGTIIAHALALLSGGLFTASAAPPSAASHPGA
ncbi:TetR/AcrR family transcriptional regulator [Bordetella genomosp. 7]|uniref:TetR family transcriptional regulator n=1 Tax=Bordetella genomosp. 7 TaxID=1416805 RepID=A0A261RCB8_9BORD|nr:TetR/AcrR family transcriptional regulator [Bordetella genomosp. 7]OZI22668.1 TetR family transcriptional regulator [Bordetella genomosp. 7]